MDINGYTQMNKLNDNNINSINEPNSNPSALIPQDQNNILSDYNMNAPLPVYNDIKYNNCVTNAPQYYRESNNPVTYQPQPLYQNNMNNNNNINEVVTLENDNEDYAENVKCARVAILIVAIMLYTFLIVDTIFHITRKVHIFFLYLGDALVFILACLYVWQSIKPTRALGCAIHILTVAVWFGGFAIRINGIEELNKKKKDESPREAMMTFIVTFILFFTIVVTTFFVRGFVCCGGCVVS